MIAGIRRDSSLLPTASRAAGPAAAVEVLSDMTAAADIWRDFESRAEMTIFQKHAWLAAWQKTVGAARGCAPRIAIVRDESGRCRMILPLMLDRRFGVPCLMWMAEDEADYHAPLVDGAFARMADKETVAAILTAVANAVPDAQMVDLCKTARTIGNAPNPLAALPHTLHPSAAHAITLGHDWESLYAALRSKDTRRKDRQRRRRLEQSGSFRLETARGARERHRLLDRILEQKSIWLRARGIADPFASAPARAFLHKLIDTPSLGDTLHISAMTLDGVIVAGNFGYVQDGRFYAVIGSIADGPVARHSPGIFHLHELIKWCISEGIATFDLTVGDEGYKADWCDTRLDLVDIRLALSLTGSLAIGAARARGSAKRYIKTSPRLFAAAQTARRTLRRVWPA